MLPAETIIRNEEWVTAEQARQLLGIGRHKLAALLASGILSYQESTLDKRVKLVKREDVTRLQEERKILSKRAS